MRLTRTIAPEGQPITLDEAKLHCRVDHDDEDALLTSLITAATDYLDGPSGILGRAIINQTWLLELDTWPTPIALPIEPVTGAVVTYVNELGAEVELAGSDFVIIDAPSAHTVLEWADGFTFPTLSTSRYPVKITLSVGFGAASDVPEGLKVALKMMVSHWYENRGAVVVGMSVADLPMAVNALLARYRVML